MTILRKNLSARRTYVRMPKMRAGFAGEVIISKGRSRRNRALRYIGYTVHIRRSEMMLTMPVHRSALRMQHVDHVDYYPIALAYLG